MTALVNKINTLLNFEDLLFKDFFQTASFFDSVFRLDKINYPVDIIEHKNAIELDIAAVDIDKEDIIIEIKDNVLKVSYKKKDIENEDTYLYKGIARRSFNFGWKIMNPRIDLAKMDAKLEKGLLKIIIPLKDKDPNLTNDGFRKINIK